MKNKTPAVLLYYEDFLAGTAEMTDEEVGQYIRLLCYQNAKGHLTEEYIKRVVPAVKAYVLDKFTQDDSGALFNERMEAEILRRVKYSESRKKNGVKAHADRMQSTCKAHAKHTETETVTVTVNSNNNKNTKKAEEKLNEIRRKAGLPERGNNE